MVDVKQPVQAESGAVARPITFNAKYVAIAHGFFASSAFLVALVVGCWLHYHKIVKNASFGYPDEWFPSVSAAIGDRYPERSLFQILIAVTSGPRFALLFLNYLIASHARSTLSKVGLVCGVVRTFTCGGWVYITSTDDHDWHDIFMISYMVLTIPWTVCTTLSTPHNTTLRTGRFWTASAFFGTIVPLVYWFIQHKVHVRPGAYSVYAYFEWALIILDIGFDTWSVLEFSVLEVTIGGSGIAISKAPIALEKDGAQKPAAVQEEDDFSSFEFLINTLNSLIFWTVCTSLFLCVWYFPLWDLGITGYEAVVVVFFVAPTFFVASLFRRLYSKIPFVFRILTVLYGIGAYKADGAKAKLIEVSIGTFFAVFSLVNEISSLSNQPKKYFSYTVSLAAGLLLSSVLKFMYYSNNPFWAVMHKPNGGINEWGVFLGATAAILTPRLNKSQHTVTSERKGGSIVLAALGFAGYFFCLFAFLTDSSTLVLWTWSGFPITGPTPVTGALINFIAIAAGILLSVNVHSSWLTSYSFNLFGGASALVLYLLPDWPGYAGAVGYVFYIAAIGPIIFQNVIGYNPGVFFTFSFFLFIVIALASVWIVAYAFVPAGFLLRERTDIVLFSSYIWILAGVLNHGLRARASGITKLSTVGKGLSTRAFRYLVVILAASLAVTYNRWPNLPTDPYNKDAKTFNAGIWCVHFGLDNDMWSSHDRMRDLIKDAELDIVGLLESDTQRLIGGNRDFTQKIAEDLGMYVDYGPGPNKHTWGAALLSKFPIVSSSHHLLPSPVGELAPAILATLDIYGELVDVVVFHSGQEEDVEDRRLQSLGVADLMANSTRPLVLLSYLVTKPLEGNYYTYTSEYTRMHDIDSTDWDRWCEYIMFRGLKKVAYARISRSSITDTELQVGKFRALTKKEKRREGQEKTNDFLYGNNYIEEEEVPENLRMPARFHGDGIRGHRYHVFDKPRYFKLDQ